MKIDNLKKVQRYFERFALGLEQAGKFYETMASKYKDSNENDYVLKSLKEINDITRTYEFANICHKAKEEIEQLALNDKKELISVYFKKLNLSNNRLTLWGYSFKGDPYFITQIDFALVPFYNVFSEIKEYYNEYLLSNKNKEKDSFKNGIYRHYEEKVKELSTPKKPIEVIKLGDHRFNADWLRKVDLETALSTLKKEPKEIIKKAWNIANVSRQKSKQESTAQPHREEKKEPIYPKTELNIEFNYQTFKDEYSTKLFCYLIDHYHNGKDKELSNIYQWMENNKFIHSNKRKEYKDLVKEHEITTQKYNRVHPSTEYNRNELDPTFNDLKKRFDKEIKG